MLIGVPKETTPGESRAALVPTSVKKLVSLGLDVAVEAGLGASCGFPDEQYADAGARIETDRNALLATADFVLRIRKPSPEDVAALKPGALHASLLDPFNEKELLGKLAEAKTTAISMEMVPRSTRAQKMDVLSSQANLAGYVTVILASRELNKILPMMMTPAGTISPSKVFVIGAGVAGLQAIATAKRLGARVTAFDTRPVVAEQVQSLGAKFLDIDLGETGQTDQGYAKELTPEQQAKQREGQADAIADSDIVITTAQLFGRPAPRLIDAATVARMRPGSVIVDMAVETGGNVEGSKAGEIVEVNGVKIIGLGNLPGEVARNASEMFSSNLFNLIDEFWDKESGTFGLDLEDDILKSCVITHDGAVVNETIKNL
ncbi:MAG: Re/Si-specific NAD(P)(+) transhydrogenase subunit alpha [Pseudomonadales bacterium]|jgi:NAD(P) transhydrogenase subunit alpha|nr:Re/Si-specific NAD(P)(+) transhydrogenase subunit alpha [Pseudomonadales bacterium]